MTTIRRFLAFPPFFVAMLFASLMAFFMGPFPRASQWLSGVIRVHCYWPGIVVYRFVRGVPLWEPIDLMIGMQPRTAADRKRADEHPDVAQQQCLCGDPGCSYKEGHYVWMPGASAIAATRPAVSKAIEDAKRKLVEYDAVVARANKLQSELDLATAELDNANRRLRDLEARVSVVRETYVVN